ncbi:hypothetical protein KP509_31G004100 [Ceratopteris richardii]|uniref:Uncharacterized protein n=1 Tax=Ceratopteris richardii TaxID=49495 RepID=A0A8T2QV59_CERRI|nr:hypothetical protein KP509_31G004100 [Ceratopteris richardii]
MPRAISSERNAEIYPAAPPNVEGHDGSDGLSGPDNDYQVDLQNQSPKRCKKGVRNSFAYALPQPTEGGMSAVDHGRTMVYGHEDHPCINLHGAALYASDNDAISESHHVDDEAVSPVTERRPLNNKISNHRMSRRSEEIDDVSHDHDDANDGKTAASHRTGANPRKNGKIVAESILQAAQAQAAELRALHSAVVHHHLRRDTSLQNSEPMPQDLALAAEQIEQRRTRPNRKKWKIEKNSIDDKEVGLKIELNSQALTSMESSTSSTADCYIRPADDQYPVFTPHSQNNTHFTAPITSGSSMNVYKGADRYEPRMAREELLQYIFDHDNKKNFSRSQFDDRSTGRISCFHESLDLASRSVASLTLSQYEDEDDVENHKLHYTSLNLPRGSQYQLFKSGRPNPLFDDHSTDRDKRIPACDGREASVFMPQEFKAADNDGDDGPAMDKATGQYVDVLQGKSSTMQGLTSRQRALLEFLSEEPARMRAFNELATHDTALPSYHIQPSALAVPDTTRKTKKGIREDPAPASSVKMPEKGEASDGEDVRSNNINNARRKIQEPPSKGDIAKSGHRRGDAPSYNDRQLNSSTTVGVSLDKCRPIGGVPGAVVPLGDATINDAIISNPPAKTLMSDKADHHRKHSIKGWFFRGKKKQAHQPDPSTSGLYATKSEPGMNNSGILSSSMEQQASSSLVMSAAVPQPHHVFSGLASSEAEKQLQMAMAMDLMELKVLQANTKRDAAMAEVLELRLAMDSMAKKLVEVEKHCEGLRTQLMDVQAFRKRQEELREALGLSSYADISLDRRTAADDSDLWMQDHPVSVEAFDVDAQDSEEAADVDHGRRNRHKDEDEYFCDSDSHQNREERKAAARIIGVVQSSVYGQSGRDKQPSKEEFLSAVAEARVAVKQMTRVMLHHVEEEMAKEYFNTDPSCDDEIVGDTIDQLRKGGSGSKELQSWAPVMSICQEARKASATNHSRMNTREVRLCVEGMVAMTLYEYFENVAFDRNGAHRIFDPARRAMAFYHSSVKLAKLSPRQLLTRSSRFYDAAFDRFVSRKMRSIGRAVACSGTRWPEDLTRAFLAAARAIWILHQIAFAYRHLPPRIFRVSPRSAFEPAYMELVSVNRKSVQPSPAPPIVSLMISPGFFLPDDDVVKCKVLSS